MSSVFWCIIYQITTIDNGTASLDRIDNKLGYTKDNIQWVYRSVNFMKNELDQNEFIEICKQIAEHID